MKETGHSIKDLLVNAEQAEKNEDDKLAINLYREIINQDPLHIQSYDRLMKIYRQRKEYKNELSIINTGIKEYEKFYNTHFKKHSKKINEISEKLNKSFGLIDKKGIKTYNPEPLGRWQKRKELVNKKVKS